MARYLFGGGGDGDIIRSTGLPFINATANVWSARTGGSQITDLQTVSGASITAVTSDSNGQIVFFGPDNYIGVLWIDFGSGVRWALSPKAVDLAASRAIAVQRAADAAAPLQTAKAKLPYTSNDPLEAALASTLDPLVIPRFGSQTSRDAAFPAPVIGDRCFRSDLVCDQVYSGTEWRNLMPLSFWNSGTYQINFATSGTFTLGSGNQGLRWIQRGKTVDFYLWVFFGSDTTVGTGNLTIDGLPWNFNSNALNNQNISGQCASGAGRFPCVAQPSGANSYTLWAPGNTTSPAYVQIKGTGGAPGGGSWNAGSFIRLSGSAELA
jgi:hypothetical protein